VVRGDAESPGRRVEVRAHVDATSSRGAELPTRPHAWVTPVQTEVLLLAGYPPHASPALVPVGMHMVRDAAGRWSGRGGHGSRAVQRYSGGYLGDDRDRRARRSRPCVATSLRCRPHEGTWRQPPRWDKLPPCGQRPATRTAARSISPTRLWVTDPVTSSLSPAGSRTSTSFGTSRMLHVSWSGCVLAAHLVR
jgi:hypothetical protein